MKKVVDMLSFKQGVKAAQIAETLQRSYNSISGELSRLKLLKKACNRDGLWYRCDDRLDSAKNYITEQFNESGDSEWLEGWICGYTDLDHGELDYLKDALFEHLRQLRCNQES